MNNTEKTRPRVYVAGPISLGDRKANIQAGIDAGLALLRAGFAPFIPHLSYYADGGAVVGTDGYEKWLELDFSYIAVCDALLRLPGESAGADREVAFAKAHGVQVFYSLNDLVNTPPVYWTVPAKPARSFSATDRKVRPIARGVLDYFPDAMFEVAHVSYVGNEQHNPNQPMHWAKEKSTDEADCIVRHLIDRGTLDSDGLRHSAKVAWRALALLQRELEAER